MSMEAMNAIVSRAAGDTTYRTWLFEHFDAAVSSYDLSSGERALLKRVTPAKFDAVFARLDEWDQPYSSASMELMMLLFGANLTGDEGSVTREYRIQDGPTVRKTGPTVQGIPVRTILIAFAGIVVVGLLLAIIVALTFGPSRGNNSGTRRPNNVTESGGGDTQCPCTCVEECREGAVTCVTICADCNGDRCVP